MKNLYAFARGVFEFRRSWTWADPARAAEEGGTLADEWYDFGRDLAHRLTLRRFDY